MDTEISFERLHLSEYCFDEGRFPDSVFSYYSYSLSFAQYRTAYEKKWLMSSDKSILDLDQCLGSVFVV